MVSDSDGSNSSVVILRRIHEKLVDYKKSLLRQLLDEQEIALESSKELAPEDVEEDRDDSVAEHEVALFEGDRIQQEDADAAVVETVADAVSEVEVDTLKPVDSRLSYRDPSAVSSALADEPKKSIFEKISVDVGLKKRRLAEVEVEGAVQAENKEVLVKKAKRSQVKREKKFDDRKEHTGAKKVTVKSVLEIAADQESLPQGTPYRVLQKTSVPPNKYLLQKRREEEASDREAAHQQQQPLLLASPAISKRVTCSKRSASTLRSSLASMNMIKAEFDRRLREHVRLYREVNKRSHTVKRKRQLPRLPIPARGKAHWDFLLDEMKWMATDFAQERNWKRVLQHRLAADVIFAQNSGSVRQEVENRQMARGVALQISAFWRTMERIAARSQVQFEAAGTDRSDHGEIDDTASGGHPAIFEDDSKQGKSEDVEMSGVKNDNLALKFDTTGLAASNVMDAKSDGKGSWKSEEMLTSAKSHVTYIVSAGKRARSAMTSLSTKDADAGRSTAWSLREAAFQSLQARCTALQAKGRPNISLATFQLLALRWMLDLYFSGFNMFLNDQLGMGKAATIVAFLSLIEIVSFQKQQQEVGVLCASMLERACGEQLEGPHLIVVSEEELHKWRHYLRVWHPDRRIQLYDGVGKTSHYKEQLQREWNVKLRAQAHKGKDDFLVAPPNNNDDEELDDDERAEPLYCVLCPVGAFAEDRQAFVAFTYWQMVVVEKEHGGHFDDLSCVFALQQLRQQQRRVLCNGQSIENWKNTALRLQYAGFVVREASTLNNRNAHESCCRAETWPVQELLVERSSVAEVMQIYGKSSSARAALWKASSQQEDFPKYMNALLLSLSCLSLRRVRSEVETELRKIDEICLSCQPSLSQKTQYRNALSGFAATLDPASGREERLSVWLQLLLRLRQICNCVDLVNDMDKLGHADLRLLTRCSTKLEALEPLLRRLALQEGKKVVIYCQFHGMFPVLELFLSLLDLSYVRITGSIAMQRRALYHFADRTVARVALASTRLSTFDGGQAVSVYGSEAIVVMDSDWNATCDAKLRASWAKMAIGGTDTLSVYRLHCENTVEASLLRVGASLTEKVFGEITPQELLAVPSDMALSIKKPSWWSPIVTSSGGNGLIVTGPMMKLASLTQQVEQNEKFCGSPSDLEAPLIVYNVDLDAEEHLLLANTDELTPVEWYAVNYYVHDIIDKKQQQGSEVITIESEIGCVEDEGFASSDEKNALFYADQRSFDKLATLEVNRHWQEGDAASQLFFKVDSYHNGVVCESALESLFMQMRTRGMETYFDVYKPPLLRSIDDAKSQGEAFPSRIGVSIDTQMEFRVSYRVPVPPLPVPQSAKLKLEHAVGQHGDQSKLIKSSKKQRASAAVVAAGRSGFVPISNRNSMNFLANSTDVKRKLEAQLGGIKLGPQKEQRVDLEGIPVPDVEFADDDFWGDTNLVALDSAEWDDPALLGGILGVGVSGAGAGASYTATSSCSTFNGAGECIASGTSGVVGSAIGPHADLGRFKTPFQKSSKKPKAGTGRVRKSGMSSFDPGRDAWSMHDDVILRKLFELYGPNWTLIAQVLYSTTAVSHFVCKKRSPRQCYDRYSKIMSGSLTMATSGAFAAGITKDGKSVLSLKPQHAASVAAAQLTSVVLDSRIGLTQGELLINFSPRHSFPGLPPPSIVSAPSLVEAHRQKQLITNAAGTTPIHADAGGLDDLKSIKTSFDAIIQCMKHKTLPPSVPIPGAGASSTISGPTATPPASAPSSTDLGIKASLTAASFPSSQASTLASALCTPIQASAKGIEKATVPPVAAAKKAMPVVVPPPHKSYKDMISLLQGAVLGPDEVIKRSKEAALVAVQAATVATIGRECSPLSASGDVMLGAGSEFGVSVSSSIPRRSHAASLTSEMSAVSVMSISTIPSTSTVATAAVSAGARSQTTTAATTEAWGGIVQDVSATGLNGSAITSGSGPQRNAPIPVTTSTLLHVLDRMPEIKNKIQIILNRTDCSESQKVAMIARLLSNTNAINNTNALGATDPMPSPDVSIDDSSAVLVALTTDRGMLSSPDMLIDTETPIPMPASLGASVSNVGTSSALSPQGQIQPPAK